MRQPFLAGKNIQLNSTTRNRVIRLLWYATLATLGPVYLWWFVLAPLGGPTELDAGVRLLAIYIVLLLARHAIRKRPLIGAISTVFALLFFALNCLYIISFLPVVETAMQFNGAVYIVTDNKEFFGWGRTYRVFVEWRSPLNYASHHLGYGGPYYKITYDPTNHVVNVVAPVYDHELVCSQGDSFRCYEGDLLQGSDRYYVSPACNLMGKDWCVTTTYTMYQCRADNTSCVKLPMSYTTDVNGYVNLQAGRRTGEIDFYLEPYPYQDPGILIYTYGPQPNCHVNGCLITVQ